MKAHKFTVTLKKQPRKGVPTLPKREQLLFLDLVDDLMFDGPIRKNWPNFGELGKDQYHCHLSYKWIVCWEWKKKTIIIEVYYVGSREKAPY